jgi:hypothetical protein
LLNPFSGYRPGLGAQTQLQTQNRKPKLFTDCRQVVHFALSVNKL